MVAVTVEVVEMEVEGEVAREGLVQMASGFFPELLFSVLRSVLSFLWTVVGL